MSNQKIYLSVIIPAYNEEKRLPKTLIEIDNYLKGQTFESEIIVVSDGSTDRTAEVVKDLMNKIKNLKLIEFKERRGKGFGVSQGMLKAQGEYRIFTDADNSTSIDQIEKMWPHFEKGYDIVIGSRDIKGAVLAVPQPWLRKIILGKGFKLLRKIIIGLWKIEDTQCGFKCFKEKVAKDVFSKITINRFGFDPEALVIAKKLGYKIKEIPIIWMNDPESKVKFKSIIEMFFELLKVRLNLILGKYGREKQMLPEKMKKIDIIVALIVGELIALLSFGILKSLAVKLGWIYWIWPLILPIFCLLCLWIAFLISIKLLKFETLYDAAQFMMIGVLNTMVDLGVLNLLIWFSGISWGIWYSCFKGSSFIIATIHSYFWNKFWTFEAGKTKGMGREFTKFFTIILIGLGINVGTASLVVNLIGPQLGLSANVWANIGAVGAAFVGTIWNFLGSKFVVFKK